jgi:hypothetical protein
MAGAWHREMSRHVLFEHAYPCSFDRGIITTMARRFEKGASSTHEDAEPCRRKGASSCT